MKDFSLTEHSVDQFVRRFEPNMLRPEARSLMLELLNGSKRVGKTLKGDQIVSSDMRQEVRFVVKDLDVCVTVLPKQHLHLIEPHMSIDMSFDTEHNDMKSSIPAEVANLRKQIIQIDIDREELKSKGSQLAQEKDRLDTRVKILEKSMVSPIDELLWIGDIDGIYDDDLRVEAFSKRLDEVMMSLDGAKKNKVIVTRDINDNITKLTNERVFIQRKLDEARNMAGLMKQYKTASKVG
jgi:hypothetical protein